MQGKKCGCCKCDNYVTVYVTISFTDASSLAHERVNLYESVLFRKKKISFKLKNK